MNVIGKVPSTLAEAEKVKEETKLSDEEEDQILSTPRLITKLKERDPVYFGKRSDIEIFEDACGDKVQAWEEHQKALLNFGHSDNVRTFCIYALKRLREGSPSKSQGVDISASAQKSSRKTFAK